MTILPSIIRHRDAPAYLGRREGWQGFTLLDKLYWIHENNINGVGMSWRL